ncbi:MAG: hypothetical protein R3B07_06880 [Polyangiaceae bacterium]
MHRLILAFGLLGLWSCGDSTQACTLAACDDHLSIDLAQSFSAAEAYSVTLELDDETLHCEGQGSAFTCTGIEGGWEPAQVVVSGGQVRGVALPRAPSHFHLVMTSNGVVVVDEAVNEITYSRVEPNGPECGPICNNGSVEL